MKGPKTMLLRTLFTLSVLTPLAAHAESPTVEAPVETESTGVGGYVALEWRAFALAGHLSHGPGFEAGAILLDGHLKVGLSGFARPGPINPEVFEVQASGGQSYKGSQTLSLRSDGGTIGVFVAPSFAVSRNLQLDVPLWFGQAAFGFYLHGDDRDTPDGRKPSAWENELQDARDSGFAMGAEGGLRLAWRSDDVPWLRPYVAARYLQTFGYDAYVRDNYSGPSVSLGVEAGRF
jgi:hypothetical protein